MDIIRYKTPDAVFEPSADLISIPDAVVAAARWARQTAQDRAVVVGHPAHVTPEEALRAVGADDGPENVRLFRLWQSPPVTVG